jgi:hypothetical protein
MRQCNAMQRPRYDGGRVKLSLARLSFAYSCLKVGFFKKYSTNVDIYIRMSIHLYEHTYIYSTLINIFKRLSRLDLKIYEVDH